MRTTQCFCCLQFDRLMTEESNNEQRTRRIVSIKLLTMILDYNDSDSKREWF